MGNSPSTNTKAPSGASPNFHPDVEVVQSKYHDAHYGDVKIVRDRKTQQTYILKEIAINTKTAFEDELRFFADRVNVKHPNVISVVGYTSEDKHNFCSTYYKVSVFIEILDHDLQKDFEHRRAGKVYYTEHELLTIADSLISALSYFQSQGHHHGDIRPFNVFCKDHKIYKLSDPSLNAHRGSNGLNLAIIHGLHTLIAPEWLAQVPHNNYEIKGDKSKADVYSLGQTLLALATLLHSEDAYDYRNGNINQNLVKERLQLVAQRYSDFTYHLIKDMLIHEPQNRPDFAALANRLAPHHDAIHAGHHLDFLDHHHEKGDHRGWHHDHHDEAHHHDHHHDHHDHHHDVHHPTVEVVKRSALPAEQAPVDVHHTPVEYQHTPVVHHTPVEYHHTPVDYHGFDFTPKVTYHPIESYHHPVETYHHPVETYHQVESHHQVVEPHHQVEYHHEAVKRSALPVDVHHTEVHHTPVHHTTTVEAHHTPVVHDDLEARIQAALARSAETFKSIEHHTPVTHTPTTHTTTFTHTPVTHHEVVKSSTPHTFEYTPSTYHHEVVKSHAPVDTHYTSTYVPTHSYTTYQHTPTVDLHHSNVQVQHTPTVDLHHSTTPVVHGEKVLRSSYVAAEPTYTSYSHHNVAPVSYTSHTSTAHHVAPSSYTTTTYSNGHHFTPTDIHAYTPSHQTTNVAVTGHEATTEVHH